MGFTVKINKKQVDDILKKLGSIGKAISQDDADKIGSQVVDNMKTVIARGTSPIAGNGRFEGYKHAGVKNKYPDNQKKKVPEKKSRPVNLFLYGDFIKSLTYKPSKVNGTNITTIYFNNPKSEKKEQGHRDGAGGQPKRPIIPQYNQGETFSKTIENIISRIARAAIKREIDR